MAHAYARTRLTLWLLLALGASTGAAGAEVSADSELVELLRCVAGQQSSQAQKLIYAVENRGRTVEDVRSLRVEVALSAMQDGRHLRLRALAPADLQDMAYLVRKDPHGLDMYGYTPALARNQRIAAHSLLTPFESGLPMRFLAELFDGLENWTASASQPRPRADGSRSRRVVLSKASAGGGIWVAQADVDVDACLIRRVELGRDGVNSHSIALGYSPWAESSGAQRVQSVKVEQINSLQSSHWRLSDARLGVDWPPGAFSPQQYFQTSGL